MTGFPTVAQDVTTDATTLIAALAECGARYDASPRFPAESLRLIVACGLHRRFAPLAAGGAPFSSETARYAAMFDALRIIGRGDLSVGRLFEGHVNALLLFDWFGAPAQLRWLGTELDRGHMFGIWATEPAPGVSLAAAAHGHVLDGAKHFASGAGGLDHAIVTAQPAHGARRIVVVPANDPQRADLSGWRVRGMRASQSGRYDCSGIAVDDAALLGDPGDYDRDPDFTAGAWRFLAVQLGGIEALLTETRSALPDTARADPLQRARFADAVAATRSAYLWVQQSAMRAAGRHPDAPDFVRMARGVVERAALDVMEASARMLGTRSAFDGERADKISRDLSLYLRQAGPDHARDQAALAWLDRDCWGTDDRLW